MLLGLLAAVLPGGVTAAAVPAADDDAVKAVVKPLSERSDAELTALAADWDALDRQERRALLTEMKLRMARQGDRRDVIHIRTERRYGRLIRQADGRLIRIETQVVHVRPLAPDEAASATARQRQGFGVGFEQRVARRAGAVAPEVPPPTIGEVLQGLESEQAPQTPLPIYQVADPAP